MGWWRWALLGACLGGVSAVAACGDEGTPTLGSGGVTDGRAGDGGRGGSGAPVTTGGAEAAGGSSAGEAGDTHVGAAGSPEQDDCAPGTWNHDGDPSTACQSCSVGSYCEGGSSSPLACGLETISSSWIAGGWDDDEDPATPCEDWRDCGQAGLCESWRDCDAPALGVGSGTRDRPCFDLGWLHAWSRYDDEAYLEVGLFHESGDIIVAGSGYYECASAAQVARLEVESGEAVWSVGLHDRARCDCKAVVAPDADLVVACGSEPPQTEDSNLVVTKLSWADGATVWESVFAGEHRASALGFDENEDVLVALGPYSIQVLSTLTGEQIGETNSLPRTNAQEPTVWQQEAAREFDAEVMLPYLQAYSSGEQGEYYEYETGPSTWHVAQDADIVGYHLSITTGGAWTDEYIVNAFRLDAFDESKVALQTLPTPGVSKVIFGPDESMLLFFKRYPGEGAMQLWLPAE